MSNVVKQKKKLTKRIAIRVDHATWRYVLRQSRLIGVTPSEYIRGVLEPRPSITTSQVDAVLREVYGPDTFGSWGTTMTNSTDGSVAAEAARALLERPTGATHPMAQPPGPPGGAGSASVRDHAGETEVSKASQRR